MVQAAAEGKDDVRSVNAWQGCSNAKLKIVSNKLLNLSDYNTRLRAALSPFHKIFIVLLPKKLALSCKTVHLEFPETCQLRNKMALLQGF